MSAGPTPERFFDTINGFQRTAAMKAAVELGLFTAIAEGHNTEAKLSAHLKIARRGARILADYMAILGFLSKSPGHPSALPVYSLAEDSALFLDRNSPAYIGAAVEFLASPHLRTHYDNLTDRTRAGGAPLTGDNSLAPSHEMWIRFARGMAGLMTMPAQMLAKHSLALLGITPAAPKPIKVLDIAAGHGMFGIAVAQQNPQAKVTGQDWANVLAVAQEHAQKFRVGDRYSTIPGSAFDVNFGHDYDLILVPNFLHHFDADTNITLLKKVHAALKPGGLVATLEFAPDSDRLSPPAAGAFALIMLASTPAGDAFTVQELTEMHFQAGFHDIQTSMIPMGMQRAITGVK